jgi:pimeloyl-ACP methyl ester carboxylesterase
MRFLTLILLSVSLAGADTRVQTATTREGVRFGWTGEKPAKPAPTVFFLGGSLEDELNAAACQEAIDALGPNVFKVSVDLPGHGADVRPGEPASMRSWRARLEHGEDVVGDFTKRATAVLNHLVEARLTDPAKVAVFGISRGGFMALHFAAADPRVRSVVGLAPVTDLLVLREFFEMPKDQPARAIAATRLADRLYDRAIWIGIGSTDYRVSTDHAIQFIERVIEAAAARGVRPSIEIHVQPSDGHTVPADEYGAAARWLVALWR